MAEDERYMQHLYSPIIKYENFLKLSLTNSIYFGIICASKTKGEQNGS